MDTSPSMSPSLPPSSSPCRLCRSPAHPHCRRNPHVAMPSPSSSTVQTLVIPRPTFPAYSRDALATATSRHTDPFNSSSIVDLRHHLPSPHPFYLFNLNDSIREFLTSLPLLYSSPPSRRRSIRNVSCYSYPCYANAEHPTEIPF